VIECRTMASAERYDVFSLMRRFRGDEGTLGEALALFVDRPDYGFIWLAYDDDHAAGCVSVSLGIDSEAGGLVATLRDFFVAPERRRRGIGTAMLLTVSARLAQLEVVRIDVLGSDPSLLPFLQARNYGVTGVQFTRQ
jgi:GNAT superfamily N-acetyltransferase